MMKQMLVALLVVTVALTASAGTALGAPEAPLAHSVEDDISQIFPEYSENYTGQLSPEEVNGLLLALNDEYHAWAVYDQVIEDFGAVRPFVNIQRAEGKHIDALLRLFDSYGVSIPDNPWVGQVDSFDSRQAACEAGVEAEILNAELYDGLFQTTSRQDILTVFESLQRASQEKHLPAFQRCAG